MLVSVIFGVGNRAGENFNRFFAPHFADAEAASVASLTLDAWITPPDYTGAAPIFLTGVEPAAFTSEGERNAAASDAPKQFAVPAGSQLVAQVGGIKQAPILTGITDGEDGGFKSITADSFRAEGTLTASGMVQVKAAGQTVATWEITVVPDKVPTASPWSKWKRGRPHAGHWNCATMPVTITVSWI